RSSRALARTPARRSRPQRSDPAMRTLATMADGCCCRAALQATRAPSTTGEAETRGGLRPRARLEASIGDLCPRQPDVDESRAEDRSEERRVGKERQSE